MRRSIRLLVLVSVAGVVPLTGCGNRCEPGFSRQDGICVDYDFDTDGGVVDGARLPGPDAAPPQPDAGPTDTGRPPVDAGPRPDSGGGGMMGAQGRLLIRGAAVLPMVDEQIILDGEVYVEDNTIACVGPRGACDAMSGGASLVETAGIVLPGLVDAHNHVAYNFLSEWSPPRVFDDSGQWRAHNDYKDFVSPYSQNKGDAASFCAMVQWGEVMALANGTTSIIGAPQSRRCFRWLVRNAELSDGYNGFGPDVVRTNTLGIDTVGMDDAASIIEGMDEGDVRAYVVHLAEGVSTRARGEFLEMRALGLMREEAVLIHATGLTTNDFAEVAAVGAKVVWSPSSNMALYQETTDVQSALQMGVSVSIAPDWTPSGTDSMLDELRFAEALVEQRWPGMLRPVDYVAMATRIPAEQLAAGAHIGTLEPGKLADILVLDGDPMVPYRSVIDARPDDIRLVVLDGVPSYGDPEILGVLADTPEACFEILACGTARNACWGETGDGPVTLPGIEAVIRGFHPEGPEPLVDCE